MNIRLATPTLALVLSAKSVFGSTNTIVDGGDHIATLTSHVNSSYEKVDTQAAQRRAKQSSSQSVSNPDGAAVKKFGAADVGVLDGIGRRNRRGNGLFSGNNRRRRAAAPSGDGNESLRFLQTTEGEGDNAEDYTCEKADTCEPNLCACVAAGGKGFQCATELNAVCNGVTGDDGTEFTIEGCVNWPDYYRNFYCPFAKCIAEEGRTFGTCGCEFYAKSYETYKDDPRYSDDEETLQHFAAHACCQSKAEDDEDGKVTCFEDAPTSMPSFAPSAPTTSPTLNPTGSPTVTFLPTISPKPTSSPTTPSPTQKPVEEIENTSPTPPTDGQPTDSPPAPTEDTPLASTPPSPSVPAPPAPISSAQNIMQWGISGTAITFALATIAWSLLG